MNSVEHDLHSYLSSMDEGIRSGLQQEAAGLILCDGECGEYFHRSELTEYEDGRLLCDQDSPQCEVFDCTNPRIPHGEHCEEHKELV